MVVNARVYPHQLNNTIDLDDWNVQILPKWPGSIKTLRETVYRCCLYGVPADSFIFVAHTFLFIFCATHDGFILFYIITALQCDTLCASQFAVKVEKDFIT